MSLVILTIDVEEGLLFGEEFALGEHLGSIECLAHRDGLQMLDVVLQEDPILFGMEHRAIEIFNLDHLCEIIDYRAWSLFVEFLYDVAMMTYPFGLT